MPFKEFDSDAHFYAFMGSAGATIPVRVLRSETKNPEQSEQQQDLAQPSEQNNSDETPDG